MTTTAAQAEPPRNVRIVFFDGRTCITAAEDAWQYEEMDHWLRTEEIEDGPS